MPRPRSSPAALAIQVSLVVVSAILLGPMLCQLLWGAMQSLLADGMAWPAMPVAVRTLVVCLSIGVIATALGWLPARVLVARGGSRLRALCLVPLLMPPYLAYSGYSMIRDPSWMIGDWLESLAAHGHAWVTIAVGRALAMLGLALWAWPIAALVLASSMSGASAEDALMLDAPRARRAWERLRMNRAGIAIAVVAVALMAIGSAVPLHLAQVETIAIDLWRQMNETTPARWGAIWLRGWPVFLPALLVGLLAPTMVRRLVHRDAASHEQFRASRASRGAAWVIWTLATLGPLTLFVLTIQSAHSLGEFWRLSGGGVLNGGIAAASTAMICGLLALSFSFAMDQAPRAKPMAAGMVLSAWVFTAIIPGVFIGAALADFEAHLPRGWGDALVVNAHVARFACIPLLAAAVSALAEPPDLRDLRLLEGAATLRGWMATCLPRRLTVVAAALAAGIMGFHEIEATTMLLPPGRDNLAQQILGYLHFSRMEEMSAASVYLIGGGLVISLFVSAAIVRRTDGS